ncbi:MAG: hypothetical protein ACYDAB_01135 [bacterium]
MIAVVVCGVTFAAALVPPPTLLALYGVAYGCPGRAAMTSAAPSPDAPRLGEVDARFPAPDRVWPLLPLDASLTLDVVSGWVARGVHPGLLLPEDPRVLARDAGLARRAREAQTLGAVPVLSTTARNPAAAAAAATFYAAMGLPPAAAYLPRGLTPRIVSFPRGQYLAAPTWEGEPALPLPSRPFDVYGQRVLPVHRSRPGGGTYAALAPPAGAGVYTPALGWRWQMLGATFVRDGDAFYVDGRGRVVLWLARVVFVWWTWADLPLGSALALFTSGLAWVALCVGAFTILALWWSVERMHAVR